MRHPDTGALLDGHITEKQAKMGNRYGPALLLMLAIGAMDWIWGRRVGLDIVGWTPTIIALAFCLLIKAFYSRMRPAPRLAELAAYGAL
jgi:hypothetical protein